MATKWSKKVLIAIGLLIFLFWLKSQPSFTIRTLMGFIVLTICGILASLPDINKIEKEDMPIPVKQSYPPNVSKPTTFKKVISVNQITEQENIFISNTKKYLEKVIGKHIRGTILWTDDATQGLSSRTDFSQFVQVGNKKVEINVSMNNNGPTQITFPSGKYTPIFLDKNLKKEHKPEISTPKEPKAPKEPKKLTNAEKKGNVIFNEEGKPEVKPNYKMIASDWINQNLEYLNKACNDAMIAGGNVVEALLAKDKLPADQEAWEAIGAMLKDQEEIDFYEITENGIIVTIE